jgi:hypothetical protein
LVDVCVNIFGEVGYHCRVVGTWGVTITSGYASQPKEIAICQLVGCNINELKAVTHVTSHGQYSNVGAHKTKEGEIVPHICCNT